MSVAQLLQQQIKSKTPGEVFSASDFVDLGSKGNLDVSLHRLSKQGIIRQLGYGLYDLPRKSSVLGDLSPDIKNIIDAYSRKMDQVFVLDPLYAANALGLTTQVPAKLTYLTNGKTHNLNICGLDIHLVHTCPKKIIGAMTPLGVIIQALRYFGPQGAPDHVLNLIAHRLTPDDLKRLIQLKSKMMRNLIPQVDRIEKIATIH